MRLLSFLLLAPCKDLSRTASFAAASHRGFHTDGSCLEGVVAGLGSRYVGHPKSDDSSPTTAKMPKSLGMAGNLARFAQAQDRGFLAGAPAR